MCKLSVQCRCVVVSVGIYLAGVCAVGDWGCVNCQCSVGVRWSVWVYNLVCVLLVTVDV